MFLYNKVICSISPRLLQRQSVLIVHRSSHSAECGFHLRIRPPKENWQIFETTIQTSWQSLASSCTSAHQKKIDNFLKPQSSPFEGPSVQQSLEFPFPPSSQRKIHVSHHKTTDHNQSQSPNQVEISLGIIRRKFRWTTGCQLWLL